MLACALLTEELARSCSKFEERAYTAGLLHDVGRLGLLLAHPAGYAELLRNATRNALELLDCEKQLLGMDHCEAGRLLAAQWNLPEELQIVAARHHDPQANYALDLLTLVHLGCRLADSLGFWVVQPLKPATIEDILAALPPLLSSRIHIDGDRWREILERRIRCYGDPDADFSDPSYPPPEREVTEAPMLAVDALAKLRFPDPNAAKSLAGELVMLVAIGLLFTTIIVIVLYFAMK